MGRPKKIKDEVNESSTQSVATIVKKSEKVTELTTANQKKLQTIIAKTNKLFGEGAVFRGGDAPRMDIEAISTGSMSLDEAVGVAGLPQGRIIEISGPEASGKTILALSTIGQAQRAGKVAAFIDAEYALTPDWVRSIGVDFDNLLITQPDSGEKALSIMKYLIESGGVDIIVLDSVAALVTQREIDGDMDANHMALTARLMSLALKKLTPIVSKSHCCCIFINQLRDNVGQMFGNKEVTPGGKALKFYSSVRLRASKKFKGEKFRGTGDDKEQIGHTVTVKVLKNKVAPPFKSAEFVIYYTSGIDQDSEVKALALSRGIVVKAESGNKHTFEELEWSSRKSFEEDMANDKELIKRLKAKVIESLKDKNHEEKTTIVEKDGLIIDESTGEILDEVVTDGDEPVDVGFSDEEESTDEADGNDNE